MAETPDPTVVDFRLPSLGSDMEAGTVIGWRVAEGDNVSKGDVLVDVDTDKSEIEVEVWHDARIERILVAPGETVAVGTPIARLAVGASGASPVKTPAEAPAEAIPTDESTDSAPRGEAVADKAPTAVAARLDGALESPARAERPSAVDGDPGVLVTPRTVYWPSPTLPAVTQGRSSSPAAARDRPLRRQNVVALAMEQSNREIPHFHLTAEIDLAPTLAWLEATNDERRPPDRILLAAVLLRAVALTVRRHHTFNGSWVDGGFVAADSVQLGVAIHMRDGTLMTPVIPDADQLALDDLMASFRALVARTRTGGLKSSDTAPPTVTVTNLGDAGADSVTGLIRPPQVALVGFGRVRTRVVVVDDTIESRPTVNATLSADHRANNGQAAAALLATLAATVRAPEEL